MKLKADRLPFAKASVVDIKDGLLQKAVYSDELKKALDVGKINVYNGPIDEFMVDSPEYALYVPTLNAVAQMWDIVQYLTNKASKPNIKIIDASSTVNTQNQGDLEIRIPLISFPVWGEFYDPPIFKIINHSLVPRIYLGNSTTILFTDQLTPGAMLIPYQDEEENWHYVKV